MGVLARTAAEDRCGQAKVDARLRPFRFAVCGRAHQVFPEAGSGGGGHSIGAEGGRGRCGSRGRGRQQGATLCFWPAIFAECAATFGAGTTCKRPRPSPFLTPPCPFELLEGRVE